MIRFITRCLVTDIAGKRSSTTMYLHMLGEVVTSMERLPALGDVAHKLLGHLVFSDMPLTVVFPDELTAAVVAGVRADRLVRVHVRYVFRLSDECAFAEGAFVGFRGAAHVGPAMELEVPLGGEGLVADDAGVRPLAAVREEMHSQVGAQVHL